MPRFPYRLFEKFVIRLPLLTRQDFVNNFSQGSVDGEYLTDIYNNRFFKESLFLASPSIYDALKKASYEDLKIGLKTSLLKYYSRASTRCTPFGLFAGVGIGSFKQNYNFPKFSSNRLWMRDTQLDMHFLVSLSKHLASLPHIRETIFYFPNNSIYKVGNKIRYVESEINKGKKDYIISAVSLSDELNIVLKQAGEGKTITELSNLLICDEINIDEAKCFIEDLIENQILTSELEPNVTRNDFAETLISVLYRIGADKEKNALSILQDKIKKLDTQRLNALTDYFEIKKLAIDWGFEYEEKYLLQVDSYFSGQIELPTSFRYKIKKSISFLNKITAPETNTRLTEFRRAFYKKFENQEIPLSHALDPELGIAYLHNNEYNGVHPYIEDLELPPVKKDIELNIHLNATQVLLNKKLQDALQRREVTINLFDSDFKNFKENWDDLAASLSVLAETITEGDQEKLVINSISGNAGKLLGRFGKGKFPINALLQEVYTAEQQVNSNKLLGEIVHLPEDRVGNVIRRPITRSYEIPYLATSKLPDQNQIPIHDLYLSVKNNKLFLRSKRHNKEVVPMLTNAHNYAHGSLPIYHFLCDYVNQDIRSSLTFTWGDLSLLYDFFPRVEYENVILSKAKWRISSNEITFLLNCFKQEKASLLISEVDAWRIERNIPEWIQIIEGDNTYVVNLRNNELLKVFIHSIRNKQEIFIEEFLYSLKSEYSCQYLFGLYKD